MAPFRLRAYAAKNLKEPEAKSLANDPLTIARQRRGVRQCSGAFNRSRFSSKHQKTGALQNLADLQQRLGKDSSADPQPEFLNSLLQ